MKKSLFEISEELLALDNVLESLEGKDEDQVAEILKWFEQLATDTLEARDRKLDNYAAFIADLEARAAIRKEEAKRLQQLAKIDENKAKRLREKLKVFFEQQNYTKLETPRYKFSLASSGGKIPLMFDDSYSPSDLPAQFTKSTIEPDMDAIRAALESGETLPFASLGERSKQLRIR
jgi:hypothetical protein